MPLPPGFFRGLLGPLSKLTVTASRLRTGKNCQECIVIVVVVVVVVVGWHLG